MAVTVFDDLFIDDDHRSAWESSYLMTAMPDIGAQLAGSAQVETLAPGHEIAADAPLLQVVLEGLIRVVEKSSSGRQVTIHYLGPGDTTGLPVTVAPNLIGPLGLCLVTVVPSVILQLSHHRFVQLVRKDPAALWSVCQKLVDDLLVGQGLLASNVFLPVRQRVAWHLLDLGIRRGHDVVAYVTQQDVADAIGSVRGGACPARCSS